MSNELNSECLFGDWPCAEFGVHIKNITNKHGPCPHA